MIFQDMRDHILIRIDQARDSHPGLIGYRYFPAIIIYLNQWSSYAYHTLLIQMQLTCNAQPRKKQNSKLTLDVKNYLYLVFLCIHLHHMIGCSLNSQLQFMTGEINLFSIADGFNCLAVEILHTALLK